MLVDKVQELNYRARDISLHSLIALFKHQQVEIKMLIDKLMDITEKGPQPDKAPWRIILGRLEILHQVLLEFGVDNRWDWRVVFNKLVAPSLFNSNADVRMIAVEVILLLFRLGGEEVKDMVRNIEDIRPNILNMILQRMGESQEEVKTSSPQPGGGAKAYERGYELPEKSSSQGALQMIKEV